MRIMEHSISDIIKHTKSFHFIHPFSMDLADEGLSRPQMRVVALLEKELNQLYKSCLQRAITEREKDLKVMQQALQPSHCAQATYRQIIAATKKDPVWNKQRTIEATSLSPKVCCHQSKIGNEDRIIHFSQLKELFPRDTELDAQHREDTSHKFKTRLLDRMTCILNKHQEMKDQGHLYLALGALHCVYIHDAVKSFESDGAFKEEINAYANLLTIMCKSMHKTSRSKLLVDSVQSFFGDPLLALNVLHWWSTDAVEPGHIRANVQPSSERDKLQMAEVYAQFAAYNRKQAKVDLALIQKIISTQ